MQDDDLITKDKINEPAGDNSQSDIILQLEGMIKKNLSIIERAKKELAKQKEMIDDALMSDSNYNQKSEEAKGANKAKALAKQQVLGSPALTLIVEKARNLKSEIREYTAALSDYLNEYSRLSGINVIEGEDGEVREIVYVAKLVKRSS